MSVVISVRIPRWVKEKLEYFGIDIASAIREYLMKLVEELERRNLEEKLEILKTISNEIDVHELSRIIDEERWKR